MTEGTYGVGVGVPNRPGMGAGVGPVDGEYATGDSGVVVEGAGAMM